MSKVPAITRQRKTGKKNARSRRASSRTTRSAIRPRRLRNASAAVPITNSATVESISGAPTIAPSPTAVWAVAVSRPLSSATAGMKVSGSAVPTAASRLPTAASAMCNRCPAHSTPLVKSSEPARIIAKLSARTIAWIAKIQLEGSGAASRIERPARDFQRASAAPYFESQEKFRFDAAKTVNDAYNICNGCGRAPIRGTIRRQGLIRPMIAGDGEKLVDSDGIDL